MSPLLIDMPILPHNIPTLDDLLITHIDNDYCSKSTCIDILKVCHFYHATQYVAQVINDERIPCIGRNINDTFFCQ